MSAVEDAHEIEPGLYLGNQRVASTLSLLSALGITHVVNCAGEIPNYGEHSGIKYIKLPLSDVPHANISQYFEPSYHFIDQALSSGGKVLVHCYAGISRSTSILSYYISRKRRQPIVTVLQKVKAIRPIIRPNKGFAAQLLEHTGSS